MQAVAAVEVVAVRHRARLHPEVRRQEMAEAVAAEAEAGNPRS
jgi:hypothetical protein